MVTNAAAPAGRGLFPLWFGILGPPVIWAVRIAANYILVPYACWWEWIWILHLTTLVGLLGAAAAGGVAWRHWRRSGSGTGVEFGGALTRSRFMALVGILSSGFFCLVIVAEGLANAFVHPCQTAGVPIPWL